MKKKIKWIVKIWEVGRKEPIITSYNGTKTYEQIVEFFGCNQPDVVKYEIKEEDVDE